MYNKDSDSLNAGAPDIRLSGNQQMASYGYDDAMGESRQAYDQGIEDGTIPFDMTFEEFLDLMQGSKQAPSAEGIMASAPGTYTQQRKQMMAGGGIAGLEKRQGYFIGKLVDKIKDDLIPNELKSPAALATIAGLGLNQFGIPFTQGDVGERIGQNWLGELLGNIPGVQGGTVDTVLGGGGGGQSIMDIFRPETISNNPVGNLDQLARDIIEQTGGGITGENEWGISSADLGTDWKLGDPITKEVLSNATGTLKNYLTKQVQQEAVKKLTGQSNQSGSGITQAISSAASPYLGTDKDRRVNPLYPLGIGAAVGKYVEGLPKDTLPMDTTSIDPAAIAAAARGTDAEGAAAGLRFLPEQVTRAASGGRMGYAGGSDYYANLYSRYAQEMIQAGNTPMSIEDFVAMIKKQEGKAKGGRIGAQEGGLMNLGGMEKDYRQEGGFVPIGGKEKADDVPARLSKNEFVFTADAVRAAGGGNIDEGAAVMERLMENLEAGGKVSEDSQGLEGARGMFANAQQLEKRII